MFKRLAVIAGTIAVLAAALPLTDRAEAGARRAGRKGAFAQSSFMITKSEG